MEIGGFTIKCSKTKTRKRKSAEINLETQINELYKKAAGKTRKLFMKSILPDCD